MIAEPQFCDWCRRPCGYFIHNRKFDGPLSCGRIECQPSEERPAPPEAFQIAPNYYPQTIWEAPNVRALIRRRSTN